jgi:S-methylmethionine-dependent homocysteine/selenocysteine methylase
MKKVETTGAPLELQAVELPSMKAAPRRLQDAAAALCAWAADDDVLADALCNETAETFQAIAATVAACRAALAQIEAEALARVAYEAKYHRDNLQAIEALGVPLGA